MLSYSYIYAVQGSFHPPCGLWRALFCSCSDASLAGTSSLPLKALVDSEFGTKKGASAQRCRSNDPPDAFLQKHSIFRACGAMFFFWHEQKRSAAEGTKTIATARLSENDQVVQAASCFSPSTTS